MLSASAKPVLTRVGTCLAPVKSYFRHASNQTVVRLSRRVAATRSTGQSPRQPLQRATVAGCFRLPTWSPIASLNSHRSLHVSSRCLQDFDETHTDSDDDVMQGSHDQTSQTVIHYGRGG